MSTDKFATENLYTALFERSVVPIVLSDINDTIIDVNSAYCRMLAYSRDELINTSLKKVVRGKERVIAEDIEKHGHNSFYGEDISKNGKIIPVKVTVFPAGDKDELLYFSIVEDVSEYRKIEKELTESRNRYQAIFENASVSLMEEDFSLVKDEIDKVLSRGTGDFHHYLDSHPEFVEDAAERIIITDVNTHTLKALRIQKKENLLGPLGRTLNKDELDVIKKELIVIAEGSGDFTSEIKVLTQEGTIYSALLNIKFPKERESLKHTIVSMMDITELKRTESALRIALKEKEVLLKELYHRTKNNMQMIGSLLSIKANIEEDKRVSEVFDDMNKRINSMALVHEKLYQSKTLSSIHLNHYIIDMVEALKAGYIYDGERIKIESTMEDIIISIEKAIPCGIVLNEIFANIFKYAFPGNRKGIVKISLSKSPSGIISLMIEDNGKGINEGFDLKTHNSLGMQLIFSITEKQLGGSADYEPSQGLIWKLHFPA